MPACHRSVRGRTAGSTDGVRNALEPILTRCCQVGFTFQAMLTAERGSALANVRTNLDRRRGSTGPRWSM